MQRAPREIRTLSHQIRSLALVQLSFRGIIIRSAGFSTHILTLRRGALRPLELRPIMDREGIAPSARCLQGIFTP